MPRIYRWTEEIESRTGLDPAVARVDRAIPAALRQGRLHALLAGGWLGHALHPLLTDLPLGSWTSATVLEIVAPKRTRTARTLLLGAGVVAAVPTIASGAVEWLDIRTRYRRVGVVHALLNVAATGFYILALVANVRRQSRLTRMATLTGGLLSLGGGYLGGHLTLGRAVGADQLDPRLRSPDDTISVQTTDGRATGQEPVLGEPFHLLDGPDGRVAIPDHCTRCAAPLRLEGSQTAVCTRDHSRFRVLDERVERGPASVPLPVFAVEEDPDGTRLRVR